MIWRLLQRLRLLRLMRREAARSRPWIVDRDGRVTPDKGRLIVLRAKAQA